MVADEPGLTPLFLCRAGRQLHEMFHLMRLNTAIGLLVGSIFMVLTDIPEIREDRHICVSFGAIIQVSRGTSVATQRGSHRSIRAGRDA